MRIEEHHGNSYSEIVTLRNWIQFLEERRGITEMPDIRSGTKKFLAAHRDMEIYFRRLANRVGRLEIERYKVTWEKRWDCRGQAFREPVIELLDYWISPNFEYYNDKRF